MSAKKKKRRERQSRTQATRRKVTHEVSMRSFDVLDHNTLLTPHATLKNPYDIHDDKHTGFFRKERPLIHYVLIASVIVCIAAAICAHQLSKRTISDTTDTEDVRTVALATTHDIAEVATFDAKTVQDDAGRPCIELNVASKSDTAYDLILRVDATIKGKTSDGDSYEQVAHGISCDTDSKGVISRDGLVQIRSVNTPRKVRLYPNFDDVTTKGTPESLSHIEIVQDHAVPSASVVDAIDPTSSTPSISLAEDGTKMHLSGRVTNPHDVTMKNVRITLTTRSMSGQVATPENREDIPWRYGAKMLSTEIGDLAPGESKTIDETFDVSPKEVTRAEVCAIYGNQY